MSFKKSTNQVKDTNQMINKTSVVWQSGQITHINRCSLTNNTPRTVWLTGLSGSGKTTLAYALESKLYELKKPSYVLDGDNIRHGLCKDLGFSVADRSENIRRVAEVSKLMNDAGLYVIDAFISPFETDRALAKQIIGPEAFFEVYLSTPIEVCESRDPKGMYKKARAGQLKEFTGIDSNYESPRSPDLILNTAEISVTECVSKIISSLNA
jgi:adenylyl-sulfate kinase